MANVVSNVTDGNPAGEIPLRDCFLSMLNTLRSSRLALDRPEFVARPRGISEVP
jgi:hypothetical protein